MSPEMFRKELLDVLACPVCKTALAMKGDTALRCNTCQRVYPIRDGIPILLEQESTKDKI